MNRVSLIAARRPWIEEETSRLSDEHLRRLAVKPGITGYAQVNGRNDADLDERAERDIYYVEHCSLWLDMYIFVKTVIVILARDGVY
jgi:lipopolysaccharide/colanic/teichoic acid biosynthesis glycosyltransferase